MTHRLANVGARIRTQAGAVHAHTAVQLREGALVWSPESLD